MKGTEKEVEMGTKDSNGLQINEWCRHRRSGHVSTVASLARLDAPDSELFTVLDQRRPSRTKAECYPHRRRNGLDGSDRDGFSNERGMTRHQELECTDKDMVGCWRERERELESSQFRRRLQHPQQSLRVQICNATGGSVECIGQRQVGQYHWMLSGDAEVRAVHSGRPMTSRTRMTKLPEPIVARSNENVTEQNCQCCRRE